MDPDESDRPYLRVAGAIRSRIVSGDLRPGERVPSTRQVVRDFGVAMATATRALAVLRDEGLVVTRPGSGTVVRSPEPPSRRSPRSRDRDLTTGRIVATGLAVADAEGLEAASMRRIAAELGVAPMSLYRYLAGREELEHLLVRAVFRAHPLPEPGPAGWRAKLELACRVQWRAYRRHPWLPELVSLTRPLLLPEAMSHTEWTLKALARLDLSPAERAREVIALASLVRGLAASATAETRAERETGQANDQWWVALDDEVRGLMASGHYPQLASVPERAVQDLDALLEHAMARHLDGLAAHLAGR
ncbi:GntR family transcriptional regulator [Pseudonocardia kunmingensis]|uniref:TetR family transcriptional regulator n=1 Tax=Pseudonocardia kunmingensis TaxID=630975 RepID=A0A543E122_9PSEU|nr:GntR family transcriptional regulator [Pseudonocardia kunmingensis]TQM15272.1 TetR family transcriptional regulator [Pseudonocardia kunmingensis]